MTIHFHIPGAPVGKGRPRIGKVGAVLLEGWERSRGASLEAHIAHSLGMRLVYPGEVLEAA